MDERYLWILRRTLYQSFYEQSCSNFMPQQYSCVLSLKVQYQYQVDLKQQLQQL